ncbi:MAG: hypothetical protein KF791_18495 [Verrucomicrobiae bacterium]|nr:hypothetical protein [Verrucomicrobiae bacterium]
MKRRYSREWDRSNHAHCVCPEATAFLHFTRLLIAAAAGIAAGHFVYAPHHRPPMAGSRIRTR